LGGWIFAELWGVTVELKMLTSRKNSFRFITFYLEDLTASRRFLTWLSANLPNREPISRSKFSLREPVTQRFNADTVGGVCLRVRLGACHRRSAYLDSPNQALAVPVQKISPADIPLSSATGTKEKRTTA
jgi:hypothetical protein